MTYNTMNNDVTLTGGGNPLLAGRYQVVRQLGTGGMGSVWLAEDRHLDNKLFAVKMLPSVLVSNKRAYRQLKDEALVAMRLVHPNIVQIRAFEENNGNPFLVMDYVEGQTLDDYLAEKGKLSEDEATRLLKPIAAALDYAHGESVVHRDVKPANVMIRNDGHPFVLDFGIAREIQETMTRVTGKLSSGTLLYMSPEQLNGDSPKPAQDIYSFAAMVYECLNGEPPFSHGQIEFQIMNKAPELLVGVGVTLACSVMSGLAKKPEDRPATCASVLTGGGFQRRAAEAQSGRARIPAVLPQEEDSGRKERQERKDFGWGVGVLALLAALGVAYYAWSTHEEAIRRRAAEHARIIAEQKAEEERRAQESAWKKAQDVQLERQKKAEEERKARENKERAKDAASEIRIEAKVQKSKVEQISPDDGFKQKLSEASEQFARADALFDAKRWQESNSAFSNYVKNGKLLVAMDARRQTAVRSRKQAQSAFKTAETAGAKIYAKDSWNAAVETWQKAVGEFERMEFLAASASFDEAAGQFADSGQTARENKRAAEEKKAKEKQEEERRAEEARRKAMRSLVGRWRGKHKTKTLMPGGVERENIIESEIVFKSDGTFSEFLNMGSSGQKFDMHGSWVQSGNRLTMRLADYNGLLPAYGNVKNNLNQTSSGVIKWCADDAFTLLCGSGNSSGKIGDSEWTKSYDVEGNCRTKYRTKRMFMSDIEYEIIETPTVFRRVSN